MPAPATPEGVTPAAPDATSPDAAPDGEAPDGTAPDGTPDAAAPEAAAPDGTPDGTAAGQAEAAASAGEAAPDGAAAPAFGAAPPAAAPPEWVAELWVDPDWYRDQGADDPCPSPGPPVVLPLLERSLLIGRRSASRNIHPQIDCLADFGVSRRHAQLTTDGQRWWVEDLRSANGTFVGPAGGPLPSSSIAPGLRHELAEDERLYLGAWTRIVIRRATADEQHPVTATA
jgi:FHA domain